MQIRHLWILLFSWLAIGVAQDGYSAVRVVTTNSDLAAIAQAIGGNEVQVTALAKASQNPHDVDARPSLLVPLSRADLLILTGLQLENGWLPPLLDNARNRKIQQGQPGYVDASQLVEVRGIPTAGTDRASGDVHPAGNPHYLYDPRAAKNVAKGVRDALIRIRPSKREHWTTRTDTLITALDRLSNTQQARFKKLPASARRLVSYHDSTEYLFDWLGITQVETLEPLPGIPPTPRHISQVLQKIRDQDVPAIVQEPYYPRNTAQTLTKLAKIELVIIASGTDFPKQTYIERIQELSDTLYKVLAR